MDGGELHRSENSFELNKEERPPGNVDIELGLQGDVSGTAQPGLDGFFEQVREIEKLLETLAKLIKDLQATMRPSSVNTTLSRGYSQCAPLGRPASHLQAAGGATGHSLL
ncbi:hypothetical protein ZWY2020_025490 [Hordeum vulgare]|nr:hypothetical protein ZWY2020_025490 [Hordeum vulgare]